MYAGNEIELDDKLKVEYSEIQLSDIVQTVSNSNINSISCRSESVNGFMFEAEFFESCKHGLIESSSWIATLSFTISHVAQPVGCLATMRK